MGMRHRSTDYGLSWCIRKSIKFKVQIVQDGILCTSRYHTKCKWIQDLHLPLSRREQ